MIASHDEIDFLLLSFSPEGSSIRFSFFEFHLDGRRRVENGIEYDLYEDDEGRVRKNPNLIYEK
jgi:hypothetical protein